jgi:hypothetical protein
MPEKAEGSSRYQNSAGVDSPKSALETEDHVLRDEHISQSMSRLIRDDQHMTVHLHSKGYLLTPALKVIRWTRAEHLLQWHAENGNKNIFTDEKIFSIEEQYNHQNNKIYAQMSRKVKENIPRVQGGHHPSYVMVWWEVSHQGVTHLHVCKKGVKLVSECIKRTCYKAL